MEWLDTDNRAEDLDNMDIQAYRERSLTDILHYIRTQPGGLQRSVALELENALPERIDLWLFRRVIGGNLCADINTHANGLAKHMILGITHPGEFIRTSCYGIVGRLDYRLTDEMFRERGVEKDFLQLIELLSSRDLSQGLAVPPLEKNILLLLVRNAYNNLNEVIEKEPLTVNGLQDEYERLREQILAIDRTWVPGRVLTFLDRLDTQRKENGSGCIPWPGCEYLLPIAVALDNYRARMWRVVDANKVPYHVAKEVLKFARDLQQSAWLMVRSLRKFVSSNSASGVNVNPGKLHEREQQLLVELASLERYLSNHVRAGLYAAFALQLSGQGGGRLTPAQTRKSKRIASNVGFICSAVRDKSAKGRAVTDSGQDDEFTILEYEYTPRNLGPVVVRSNPQVARIVNAITSKGFNVAGLESFVERVSKGPKTYDASLRTLAFELALRLGMLCHAATIAVPSKEATLSLSKEIVLLYARALASVYQKGLVCVHHHTHDRRLRPNLRRMWKKTTSLNFDETLFIHEAKRGLLHAAIEQMKDKDAVVWGTFNQLSRFQRECLYDHLAEKVAHGMIEHLDQEDVCFDALTIPGHTVFVSVSIRDGHELSIVFASKDGCYGPIILKTIGTDKDGKPQKWSAISNNLNSAHELWAPIEKGGKLGKVPWVEDLKRLGRTILRAAVELNHAVQCIALATDAVMRGLPWQHLLSVVLSNYLRKIRIRGEDYRSMRPWEGVLVQHVPGVSHFIGLNSHDIVRVFLR